MRFLRRRPQFHMEPLRACCLVIAVLVHLTESAMLDLVLLALGLGFFGLMTAYAAGCDRI
jgi:hypothetical protein